MSELYVLMNSRLMGIVTQSSDGNMSFRYDDKWLPTDTPLSLSLSPPLEAMSAKVADQAIRNFMAGLLPDNDEILRRIGREHQVSPRNPFALLSAIGEDCAGAVQFVRPDRLNYVEHEGVLIPISNADIAKELHSVRTTGAASIDKRKSSVFSLAGAQPKVAYAKVDNRWFVPTGREGTTDILKPPSREHEGLIENEHFCLSLAKQAGLLVAKSNITHFEDEIAIVSTRYDRTVNSNENPVIRRIHQEDMCQVLGISPEKKYEKDGGPGIVKIMDVLAGSADAENDRNRFMRAIAFNFIIKGTDAHAKNYSILHSGTRYRLAPLYDIASILPYSSYKPRDLRASMKIGTHYHFDDITPRHWVATANTARYDPDAALNHVRDLIETLPDTATEVAKNVWEAGIGHPVINFLTANIHDRCSALSKTFGR